MLGRPGGHLLKLIACGINIIVTSIRARTFKPKWIRVIRMIIAIRYLSVSLGIAAETKWSELDQLCPENKTMRVGFVFLIVVNVLLFQIIDIGL